MKKQIILTAVLLLFAFAFTSCTSNLNNKFTFKNYSMGKVLINFRSNLYSVDPGNTFSITDVPKGTYTYATTYELPAGATGSSEVGDVSGNVVFAASTNILVVYSSTFNDGAYTIYATISNSDDQTVASP